MARQSNKLTAVEIGKAASGKLLDGNGLILDKANFHAGKWIYRYSFAGARREMGLGSYPDVSLAAARRARDKWASLILSGKDPIAERNRSKDEERAARDRRDPTFAEMAQDAFEARKASLRGAGERGRWFSPIRVHLIPKLGKRRVSEIHQSEIKAALQGIWKSKPATAEKAIQRTRIIFEYGRKSGLPCHEEIVDHAQHMLGDLRQEPTGIVSTPWADVPALFKALDRPAASYRALRWIILTGTRSDSARGARFSEIDGAVWTVPAERMKAREGKQEPFRVPLSSAALAVLEECRDYAESDLMFPGYLGTPISQNALLKSLNEMGEAGRPHGFRTSFRTWVQDHEAASYDVTETAMGHIVGSKVERSYARSDLLAQRQILMQRWGEFVCGRDAVIVQLPKRA